MTQILWSTVRFPADVEVDKVADIVRMLAAEPRGGPFSRRPPVVIETELGMDAVTWRVGTTELVGQRLRQASESALPGMTWTPVMPKPFEPATAVEVRVHSQDRLLAVERADGAAARLLGVMRELRHGERLLAQWQIGSWLARSPVGPASTKRPDDTIWTLAEWGKPNLNAEQVSAARKKTSEPVFACVGRIAVAGADGQRAHHLIAAAAGAMQLVRAPGVGVSRRAVPSIIAKRGLTRYRVPQISPPCRLTAQELAGLCGWPIGNPRLPGVTYVASRVLPMDERCLRPLPEHAGPAVLGESAYPSQTGRYVVLPVREGRRHLVITGPTGSGKTTAAVRMAVDSVLAGRATVVVDPKGGDLVDGVLARLPESYGDRVVVIDPSDPEPAGFNPLTGGVVGIDGVIHVLRSVWSDSWGPRLGDVLFSALLTLAQSPGHTLAELPLLLTDETFARPLVARAVAQDPIGLSSFWGWYQALSPDMRAQVLGPVLTRLRALLLRPQLRAVLGQAEPRFDLHDVFTKGTSLLVRLSAGQLGADGSQLLGAMIVGQLWRAAQGGAALPEERRRDVLLIVDEFGELVRLPLSFSDMLVQARSLHLSLVLLHQHLGQLDSGVRQAVLANAGSRIILRTDYDDAAVLARRSAGRLTAEDLMGLGPFEAYASVMTGDTPTEYGSMRTLPPTPPTTSPHHWMTMNRQRYGVPRAETEARLTALITGSTKPPPGTLGGRRIDEDES